MRLNATLLFLVLATACSTFTRQSLDPTVSYRRDITLTVTASLQKNKVWQGGGSGVLVVPKAASYHVRGQATGDFDLLVWQTCAQQHSLELHHNRFEFDFVPRDTDHSCNELLEIRGIDKSHGWNSSAIIAFDDPGKYTVPAHMVCNGVDQKTGYGVSACQAKTGLLQTIDFSSEVEVFSGATACELANGISGKSFAFKMPQKNCAVVFMDVARHKHLLVMIPYQDVILKGN